MLLLRCPKCQNKMKYQASSKSLDGKRKACVYCGYSMKVTRSIIKEI